MPERTEADDEKDDWVLGTFGVDPRDYDRTPPPLDPAGLPKGVLNPAEYRAVVSRNRYLAGKYDPQSLSDRVVNVVTGAMHNPARVLTDAERIEHHALSAKIAETLDPPLTAQEARLEAMEASPLGAIAFAVAHGLGGGQEAQDVALNTGMAVDGLGMAFAGARAGSATRFLGAQTGEGVPVLGGEINTAERDAAGRRNSGPATGGPRPDARAYIQRPPFITDEIVGKLPSEWGMGQPSTKKGGWKWTDPDNQGNGLRVDPANPSSLWQTQQVEHVVVRSLGVVLGRDGKPITGTIKDDPINAHIPLEEYRQWRTWNHP